nr:hypothetical protein [Bacilli bacterium]
MMEAGLDELDLSLSTTTDSNELRQIVDGADTLVVSPGRRKEIESYCKHRQEIIDFVFKPDAASVNLLRAALAEVRHH